MVLSVMLGCERAPTPPAVSGAARAPAVPTGPAVPTPRPAPGELVPAAGAIDPCVLGVWRLTEEAAREHYRAVLSQHSAPVEITSVSGVSTISMNAAGNATSTLSDVTIGYRITGGGPAVDMSLTLNATGTARFTAQGGTMNYTDSTTRFEGNLKVRIAGTEREMPLGQQITDAFGATSRGSSQYRCEPGRLVITHSVMPGAPVTWVR